MSTLEEKVRQFDEEWVSDKRGRIRQAGTVDPGGTMPGKLRVLCEKSLYHFCCFVLNRQYLTSSLHRPICNWLSIVPSYRKLLLLPRRHAKTSIVSHGLPLHILVQPLGGTYVPWKEGCDVRIMLAGETETRATDNMRVIRSVLESNDLFRGLWPGHVWDNPRKDADKWNEKMLVIPRNENYPDPSIRAIGVGGAITGARHDVHIKDDLVSEEAANSEVTMQNVINWHVNSRALVDDPDKSLEFVIGTRWAVHDLYSYIMQNDPTVSYLIRSIVEDGKTIYPEAFGTDTVERLRKEFGIMFALLYMNNIGDPDLVDFTEEDLRFFCLVGDMCEFEGDGRDTTLEGLGVDRENGLGEWIGGLRGERLDEDVLERFGAARDAYFRWRA
jgi:hypothetical protein